MSVKLFSALIFSKKSGFWEASSEKKKKKLQNTETQSFKKKLKYAFLPTDTDSERVLVSSPSLLMRKLMIEMWWLH